MIIWISEVKKHTCWFPKMLNTHIHCCYTETKILKKPHKSKIQPFITQHYEICYFYCIPFINNWFYFFFFFFKACNRKWNNSWCWKINFFFIKPNSLTPINKFLRWIMQTPESSVIKRPLNHPPYTQTFHKVSVFPWWPPGYPWSPLSVTQICVLPQEVLHLILHPSQAPFPLGQPLYNNNKQIFFNYRLFGICLKLFAYIAHL